MASTPWLGGARRERCWPSRWPACTVNVNTEGATASETHTFKVAGTAKVTLDTFDGAIEVHAWDRPEVEVVVEKQAQDDARLQDITVEKSQDGDHVTLRVRGPAWWRATAAWSSACTSRPAPGCGWPCPRRRPWNCAAATARSPWRRSPARCSLRTDDGSIVASRLSGEVLARTDDGSIRFREITGKLDVETGDGSIVVNGTLTHLRAKTGDGSVRWRSSPGSRVEDDWTRRDARWQRRGAAARGAWTPWWTR